ncbi:hypothetical protein Tco_1177063 [Tanacetum coccineum]
MCNTIPEINKRDQQAWIVRLFKRAFFVDALDVCTQLCHYAVHASDLSGRQHLNRPNSHLPKLSAKLRLRWKTKQPNTSVMDITRKALDWNKHDPTTRLAHNSNDTAQDTFGSVVIMRKGPAAGRVSVGRCTSLILRQRFTLIRISTQSGWGGQDWVLIALQCTCLLTLTAAHYSIDTSLDLEMTQRVYRLYMKTAARSNYSTREAWKSSDGFLEWSQAVHMGWEGFYGVKTRSCGGGYSMTGTHRAIDRVSLGRHVVDRRVGHTLRYLYVEMARTAGGVGHWGRCMGYVTCVENGEVISEVERDRMWVLGLGSELLIEGGGTSSLEHAEVREVGERIKWLTYGEFSVEISSPGYFSTDLIESVVGEVLESQRECSVIQEVQMVWGHVISGTCVYNGIDFTVLGFGVGQLVCLLDNGMELRLDSRIERTVRHCGILVVYFFSYSVGLRFRGGYEEGGERDYQYLKIYVRGEIDLGGVGNGSWETGEDDSDVKEEISVDVRVEREEGFGGNKACYGIEDSVMRVCTMSGLDYLGVEGGDIQGGRRLWCGLEDCGISISCMDVGVSIFSEMRGVLGVDVWGISEGDVAHFGRIVVVGYIVATWRVSDEGEIFFGSYRTRGESRLEFSEVRMERGCVRWWSVGVEVDEINRLCTLWISIIGELLSPDRVFDFLVDEPEPHPAYNFFSPRPLPEYAGNPNNNNGWIEADVPLLGELGAVADEPMVGLLVDEIVEPIVKDDDSEGFDEEVVWEVNEEWLMASVTPPRIPAVHPPSVYEVWKSVGYSVSMNWIRRIGNSCSRDHVIFQNIILIPYLEYGVLSPMDTAYSSLFFYGLLVSVGTDTAYLP